LQIIITPGILTYNCVVQIA